MIWRFYVGNQISRGVGETEHSPQTVSAAVFDIVCCVLYE